MFTIIEQTVNAAGNVVDSHNLGIIDCTRDELISKVAQNFHRLANAYNLHYKVLGSDYTVQYQFQSVVAHTMSNLYRFVDIAIGESIAETNAYIDELNRAVRVSNKRNNRKRGTNVVNHANAKDYLAGDGKPATVTLIDNSVIVW